MHLFLYAFFSGENCHETFFSQQEHKNLGNRHNDGQKHRKVGVVFDCRLVACPDKVAYPDLNRHAEAYWDHVGQETKTSHDSLRCYDFHRQVAGN